MNWVIILNILTGFVISIGSVRSVEHGTFCVGHDDWVVSVSGL
jgi:hypothetical protein